MNKQRGLFNQMLVLGILFLFIGMSVVSSFGFVLERKSSVELIIDGPIYGKVEEPLEYLFILSGVEGWDFWLFIDWDDESSGEWYGPYLSEEEISFIHTWYECGVYNIQAIAHVINGSSFNASLEVTIKNINVVYMTVHEAFELLNDISNGVQTPIDIRSDEEWNESFIDTPYPEHPVHFSLAKMQTPEGLQEFIETYGDKEIVPYESSNGYRFLKMLVLLNDVGYSGTIYYWDGGFNAWIDEGYPIRNNSPPLAPDIRGPHPRGRQPVIGFTKTYKFTTIDPDSDKIYLSIYWDDGTIEEWFGPYDSGEEVKINHTWDWLGTYCVQARAKDIFGAIGPWGVENIPIQNKPSMALFFGLLEKFPFLEVFLRLMNL